MKDVSEVITAEAIESLFSEYNSYIYKNYGILGIDAAYGTNMNGIGMMENRAKEFAIKNASPEAKAISTNKENFFRMTVEGEKIDHYGVLTDNNCCEIIHQGATKTGREIGPEILNNLKEKQIGQESTMDILSMVTSAQSTISGTLQQMKDNEEIDESKKPEPVEDNPLEAFSLIWEQVKSGILSSVLVDDTAISKETIDKTSCISNRTLFKGNSKNSSSISAMEKVMFAKYLNDNFGCYEDSKGHEGLQYEIEYVICNKASDKENLASVAKRILMFRLASNYGYLMSDGGKQSQANSIAAVLTWFAPALEPGVTAAILAAWAYVESLLDVRCVFSGGKVPLVKSSESWTSDVFHLSQCLNKGVKAKSVSDGLSYGDYLCGMIILTDAKKLGNRSAEVMEQAVRLNDDYKNLKMDHMVYKAELQSSYRANQMFFSFIKVSSNELRGYKFNNKKNLKY